MKVDFSQKLNVYQDGILTQEETVLVKCPKCGEEIIHTSVPTLKKIVLGLLFIEAAQTRQVNPLSGQEKVKRYRLAMRIDAEGIVDLESDEIEIIKKLAEERHHPLIVGQVVDMLSCKEPVEG